MKIQKLLIIGCRRSGTTLLGSLLGAHSQINMLNEAYGDEVSRLIGKRYQGVKLVYPHIDFVQTHSRVHRLLYHKLVFIRVALRKVGVQMDMRIGGMYSIRDYEEMDAMIVVIHREKDDNVKSMVARSHISKKKALRDWWVFNEKSFGVNGAWHINLSDLTGDTEQCLRHICKYLDVEFEEGMLLSSGLNNSYKNDTIERKR